MDLSRVEIPVPCPATQQKVVDILDRFDTLTKSLTDSIPAEIEARRAQYGYYRDRLLDFPRWDGGFFFGLLLPFTCDFAINSPCLKTARHGAVFGGMGVRIYPK